MRVLLFTLALVAATRSHAGAPPAPTHAAVRKAYEAAVASVVEVRGPKRRGPGVVVSDEGHIATSVDCVGLESARVRAAGEPFEALVVSAHASSRVAVLQQPDAGLRAASVRVDPPPERGEWLVAVAGPKSTPKLTRVLRAATGPRAFFRLSAPLPSGTPLFDSRGRLVGLVVGRSGGLARALPMDAVRQQLLAEPSARSGAAAP